MITNVYAPFSLSVHLVICIVATLFYGYMFIRKKYSYYFTLILAFDLTLFTQMNISKSAFYFLTIIEIFLIILMLISMVRVSRKNKKLSDNDKSNKKAYLDLKSFNDKNV